ncbi:MAG: ABC transporter ATP-binding protein, partial [Alteromonadaceae bacterium]|nr:ABC transporter ATP-binding protein [Alteromonadaceae bacterium]
MFKRLKTLFKLLAPEQRKRLLKLQFLVVLMAFAEVAGVAAIGPFMALVGDISLLEGDGKLAQLYALSGFENPRDFLFWLGIAVLTALSCA